MDLSVWLNDGVRVGGQTLSGLITLTPRYSFLVSAPSAQNLEHSSQTPTKHQTHTQLSIASTPTPVAPSIHKPHNASHEHHNSNASDTDTDTDNDNDEHSDPLSPHSSRLNVASPSSSSIVPSSFSPVGGPSCSSSSFPLSHDLSVRLFSLMDDLRVQVVGKLLVDGNKIDIKAFVAKVAPNANTKKISQSTPSSATSSALSFWSAFGRPANNQSNAVYTIKMFDTKCIPLNIQALLPQQSPCSTVSFPASFEFSCRLPANLPPSFRGCFVQFQYSLNVYALKSRKKLLEIHLPFRVRLPAHSIISNETQSAILQAKVETPIQQTIPINHRPLKEREKEKKRNSTEIKNSNNNNNTMEIGSPNMKNNANGQPSQIIPATQPQVAQPLQSMNSLPSSPLLLTTAALSVGVPGLSGSSSSSYFYSSPLVFNISKTFQSGGAAASGGMISPRDLHVVRVTLGKHVHRPGDTVRGHLDFSSANVRCYRVVVTLENEEKINERYCVNTSNSSLSSTCALTHRRVFWSWHQYTRYSLSAQFMFSIPMDVAPNFSTDLLSFSWNLSFKFITDTRPLRNSDDKADSEEKENSEVLCWTLPLSVIPLAAHATAPVMITRNIFQNDKDNPNSAPQPERMDEFDS